MTRVRFNFMIISIVLFLFISTAAAQDYKEYSVTAEGRTLTFIPQPDLGFVIQSKQQDNPIEDNTILQETLSLNDDTQVRQIKGSDRQKLSVVLNQDSADNNLNTINTLNTFSNIKYSAPLFSVNGQTVAIIPEVVVKLAFDSESSLSSACEILGLTIKKQMEFTELEYLIEIQDADADAVFTAIENLNQLPYVDWAVPNTAFEPIYFDQIIPNDQYFRHQWHLYNYGQSNGQVHADVNAPLAWSLTTGDPNIVIAIVDTGVDVNHPDLINNIVPGYDFFDSDNIPEPSLEQPLDGHGTNCAGLAAAQGNNSIGVTGVAWNCKIMPIRIGNAEDFTTDADIATAFRWAAENGADILSNSWGALYSSQVIYSAVLDITDRNKIGRNGKGCVVVCAAGNWEEGGPVTYPAAYPSAIAVGATDHKNELWYYSGTGPELDIVAPSGGTRTDYFLRGKPFLWTTDIRGVYGSSIENLDISMLDYSDTMSGTSGACPIVAGVAALVMSIDPNFTNIDVKRILLGSAVDLGDPGVDESFGYGLVDAFAAVTMALNPPSSSPSSEITIYVDDDAFNDPAAGDPSVSDPNEDGTANHPFDSIQKAIDSALYAETILVADGTYSGIGNYDIDFDGKALRIRSENGAENCIVDCQENGRGFYLHNSETEDSLIEGFTIINGKAYEGAGIKCSNGASPTITNIILKENQAYSWGQDGGYGGGIFINYGCNPVITGCRFVNNIAIWNGGGIYNNEGNLSLENCEFNQNMVGYYGGGICSDAGTISLTNCTFSNNSAQTLGGAITSEDTGFTLNDCDFIGNTAIDSAGGAIANLYGNYILNNCRFIENSTAIAGGAFLDSWGYPTFNNCIFEKNSSDQGGALYEDWGYPEFQNCIFADNSAVVSGGALFYDWSDSIITNCTFASNHAADGNAIACDSYWYSSDITITNSILWGRTEQIYNYDNSDITITYSNAMKNGAAWTGQGNINTDPLFADPNNGDYHLKSTAGRWNPASQEWVLDQQDSPCIDAGDSDSDYSAEPQPNGNCINMGAYGGTYQASKSSE